MSDAVLALIIIVIAGAWLALNEWVKCEFGYGWGLFSMGLNFVVLLSGIWFLYRSVL